MRNTLNRYRKSLSGLNFQGFVSPALAYTTDATFADFTRNAPEGEIGVFLKDGTLKTTALAAGEEFFIAQKRAGTLTNSAIVSKSQLVKFNEVYRIEKTDYDAPTIQQTSVGYDPISGTGSLNLDLSIPGTKELVITVRVTTPASQPFPVEEGYIVTTATSGEYTEMAKVVRDLNNAFDYQGNQDESVIVAGLQSDVTPVALANGASVFTGSTYVESASHGLAVGDFVAFNTIIYQVTSVNTNDFQIDSPYAGATEVIAAGVNAGSVALVDGTSELGVLISGIDTDIHFTVGVQQDLANASIRQIQDWKQGSGDGPSIIELEKESAIFSGVGSTANAQFKDDYGQPTFFGQETQTYNQIFVSASPATPKSMIAEPVTKMLSHFIIAAPSAGTTPDAALSTIFGV